MTRNDIHKQIRPLLLALCILCAGLGLVMTSQPVHAAGSKTITINYSAAANQFQADFQVYKVGSYISGTDLQWDESLGDIRGQLPENISENDHKAADGTVDTNAWSQVLADSAYQLQTLIRNGELDLSPVDTVTTALATGSGIAHVSDNGLYLVLGSRQVTQEEGADVAYEPVPAMVAIYNEAASVTVKPTKDRVKRYMIRKEWLPLDEDMTAAEQARKNLLIPDSIDVKLSYSDDGTTFQTAQSVEVAGENGTTTKQLTDGIVTLTKEDSWSFAWESDNIERTWAVEEVLPSDDPVKLNFLPSQQREVLTNGTVMLIKLKNTYTPRSLEITKNLTSFVAHSGAPAATIVFKVEGYADDQVVYETHVSVIVDEKGTATSSVSGIPANLQKLVVTEVYTGNYKPSDEASQELTAPDSNGVYAFTFANDWDETVDYGGGVINEFALKADEANPGYEILRQLGLKE